MTEVSTTLELTDGADGLVNAEEAWAREAQFEALVSRQARFAFRVAFALLRNAFDAEDVVQETFLKLYRSGAWRLINDERAYLACTVWRIATGRSRLKGREGRGEQIEDNIVSAEADPEEAAMTENRAALVRRLVDTVPEELRQPIALSTIEELNSRQIAEIMGIPEGTVRTRVMRARQILREKLSTVLETRRGR